MMRRDAEIHNENAAGWVQKSVQNGRCFLIQSVKRPRRPARGGDINGAVIALRLVLLLERVPCLPQ